MTHYIRYLESAIVDELKVRYYTEANNLKQSPENKLLINMESSAHAHVTFEQVRANGEPSQPLEIPDAPVLGRGVFGPAWLVQAGIRQRWPEILYRRDLGMAPHQMKDPLFAYWPQKHLQKAIFGSVLLCVVLRPHRGVTADDAARAEDGSIVWEPTENYVAIKMANWKKMQRHRGVLLEDPLKEISAMQYIGNSNPHVLGLIEVLNTGDDLCMVMHYCGGGELFGVVSQYAEESGGNIGMPEPVARYWFRQILSVSLVTSRHVRHWNEKAKSQII